jgi:hypothetical protein
MISIPQEYVMKVLAVLTLKPEISLSAVRAQLADELRGSWGLYSSGLLREVYATESPTRVVFVLETMDVKAAADSLNGLPLVAAGMFHLEMMELRPFVNWAALFAR